MTRLSSVMTGCGLNETTCSRRSTRGRTRSTYGSTIRMPRASVTSTTTAITMRTIRVAKWVLSLFVYQRRRAVDLEHLDPRAGLEGVVLVICASAPDLAAELHGAAVAIHAVEHHRRATDEGRRAGAQLR